MLAFKNKKAFIPLVYMLYLAKNLCFYSDNNKQKVLANVKKKKELNVLIQGIWIWEPAVNSVAVYM